MKRLYLCGPMTGLPQLNFPAFNAEAERLRALGYDVINPAELAEPGTPWAQCMRTDIRMLLMCDAIAMLPGWERSRGANLEWLIATELGMPVLVAEMIGNSMFSAVLPAEASVVERARHFAQTATVVRLASEEHLAEAAKAHEQASKFLRMAVEAAVRGVEC
jgi:hypothetical protein